MTARRARTLIVATIAAAAAVACGAADSADDEAAPADQAVLEAVLSHIESQGDTVLLVQRVYCASMDYCPDDAEDLRIPIEIERAAASFGAGLVLATSGEDFPPCGRSVIRDGAPGGGFLVWFARPVIEDGTARVHVERACMKGRAVFARGDAFELERRAEVWTVVNVRHGWIT